MIPAVVMLAPAAALENDSFEQATGLGSTSGITLAVDSRAATRQVGEPGHDGDSSTGSAWWTWTAPADGLLWLALPDASNSGTRAVYEGGSLDSLVEIEADSSGVLECRVEAGRSYAIALAEERIGRLVLEFHGVPGNDDFENRQDLGSAGEWTAEGTTLAASREEGEPLPTGDTTQGPSIWWTWQAPEDGILSFDLAGSDSNGWVVGIYAGDSLATLETRHESNRYSHIHAASRQLRVQAGETLSIVAAVDTADKNGSVILNGRFEPAVAQVDPASAVDLGSVADASGQGTTVAAVAESGINSAVWWQWTAPSSGLLSWNVSAEEGVDLRWVAVYDAALKEVAYRSLDGGYPCVGGETYYLAAATDADSAGVVSFELSIVPSAANDDRGSPAPLILGENPFNLHAAGVDSEEIEWSPNVDRSLWWSWTPPADGVLWLEVDALFAVPSITVWESPASPETLLGTASTTPLSLEVVAGVPLEIQLSRNDFFTDEFGVDYLVAGFVPQGPDNDDFADAADLGSGLRVYGYGDPEGATAEPGEVVRPQGDASRWWKWTAPVDCYLWLRDKGPGAGSWSIFFPSRTALLRGTGLADLTPHESGSLVPAGEVLWISLGDWAASGAPRLFELRAQPLPTNDAFAAAIDLGSTVGWREEWIHLNGLSLESGEVHPVGGGSLWWKWTAPIDGNVDLSGSAWQVYAGGALDSLTAVASLGGGGRARFAVTAGESYRFALLGAAGQAASVRMSLDEVLPGDQFDAPIDLGSATGFELVPVPRATVEPADLALLPNSVQSTWWRWTAPGSGWIASVSDYWFLFREDAGGLTAVPDERVEAGVGYRIAHRLTGDWQIPSARTFRFVPEVPNDALADAIDLGEGTSVEWEGSIERAAAEAGEKEGFAAWSSAAGIAWWTWTAPVDGSVALEAVFPSWGPDGSVAMLDGTDPETWETILEPGSYRTSTAARVRVVSGHRYAIGVATTSWGGDWSLQLRLQASPGPANDSWESPSDLGSSATGGAYGSNVGALLDPIEGSYGGPGIWWGWTAPHGGNATVTAELADGHLRLEVFREAAAGEPQPVSSSKADAVSPTVARGFRAEGGNRYLFMVAGSSSDDLGPVEIRVDLAEVPQNDDLADRGVLPGGSPPSFGGSLGGMSLEPDEPLYGGYSYTASAWWSWTPDRDQGVLWSPIGASVGVLRDDGLGGWEWLVAPSANPFALEVESGTEYLLVAVAGEGRLFEVAAREIQAPGNDDFASRIDLGSGTESEWLGSNHLATAEAGEPAHAGSDARHSIWFEWRAPHTGAFAVDAAGCRVGIYTGATLESLTPVASGGGRAAFHAGAGQSFGIAVDCSSPGEVDLELGELEVPMNDDFADRVIVGAPPFVLEGDTSLATSEPMEPGGTGPRSLWWEWSSTNSSTLEIESLIPSSAAVLIYYATGENPSLADLRYSGTFDTTLRPRSGRKYFFQVMPPASQAGGPFSFAIGESGGSSIGAGVPPGNDAFADRIDLGSELGIKVAGDVFGSTSEAGESSAGRTDGTLWWSWTSPIDGVHGIRVESGLPGTLTVYEGEALGDLTPVASTVNSRLWFVAQEGVAYSIRWRSRDNQRDYASNRFVAFVIEGTPPPPGNDDFADAEVLADGWGASATGSNAAAGVEEGEPDHGGSPALASVWYRWTASDSGRARLNVLGAVANVGIYQGPGWDDWVEIAGGAEPIEFDAVAGEPYWIAIDSSAPVSFTVRVEEVGAEPQHLMPDAFAEAVVLGGPAASVALTTEGATLEGGEPYHTGYSSQGGSVWCRWIAPSAGPVQLSLDGSGSGHLAVYVGDSPGTLAPVISGFSWDPLRFLAEAGVEYHFALSTSSSTAVSVVLGLVQETVFPANDRLADAVLLEGTVASAGGTLVGGSVEFCEPWHGFSAPAATVWYRWVAPADGPCRFDLSGEGAGWLAVYEGTGYGSLLEVTVEEDSAGFVAVADRSYMVAIGVDDLVDAGGFQLSVKLSPFVPNDDFAEAVELGSLASATLVGSVLGTSLEDGEPNHSSVSNAGSAWWSWTAPADGTWILDGRDSEATLAFSIYVGSDLESLIPVADADSGQPWASWRARSGERYWIALDGAPSWTGLGGFELRLEPLATPNDAFADRRVLSPTLPAIDEVTANGASFEFGEPSAIRGGSLWWEWTATFDGWIDLDPGGTELDAQPWVGVGETLHQLAEVPLQQAASEVWRFRVEAGTRYAIALRAYSSNRTLLGRVTIRLDEAVPLPNDAFADALKLSGNGAPVMSPTRGASREPDEPSAVDGSPRRYSLWWTWTAPWDGLVALETGSGDWAAIFDDANELDELTERPEAFPNAGRFRVEGGRRYRIAAGDNSGGLLELAVIIGAEGDLFDAPVDLGSALSAERSGSLDGGSREQHEPMRLDYPPSRSRWHVWRAPGAGTLRIDLDSPSFLWMAVYSGERIDRLRCLADGSTRVSLPVVTGESYRIAIDSFATVHPSDYLLFLEFVPDGYADWRDAFFGPDEPLSGPGEDADGDGRNNLFELTTGTDPKAFDGGPAMGVEWVEGGLRLSLRRPAGLKGWRHFFELSEDLRAWTPSTALEGTESVTDQGDGSEIFGVLLPGLGPGFQQQLFFRPGVAGSVE